MPRVLRHTPRWLERPAPGFQLFNDPDTGKLANGDGSKIRHGASRTIAFRGTEVFVAVGNQLRWSDLVLLREQDYHRRKGDLQDDETGDVTASPDWDAYRVLKIPVHREIHQLVISPQQDYIAILTTHTVHVALLPDPSLLNADDPGSLKLKTWQVGPTAHVLERAPVVSAIWHPLAEESCLVTVTEDAIVRMWELNRDNRWSFDNPSLPLDLRKLANGESMAQDYSPSKYGTNAGFSPDQFDMEAVSACFGGTGAADEAGWAPITLWVAMRNGDLYALCPLLPSRWTFARSQVSHLAALVDSSPSDDTVLTRSSELTEQQSRWARDVLKQQQQQDEDGMESDFYAYDRPQQPGPIPALQGPYEYEPDADQVFDVTDIVAIAPSLLQSNASESDHAQDDSRVGLLPASIICLATSDGTVHACLDIEDTTAKWVPDHPSTAIVDDTAQPELLLMESVRVCDFANPSWPVFSTSTNSRFSFYVSHMQGISHISPISSLGKLGNELEGEVDQSSEFRLRLLAQGDEIEVSPIVQYPPTSPTSEYMPNACVHVRDSDLGDFVLTVHNGQPHAISLDFSDLELLFEGEDMERDSDDDFNALYPEEIRPSFTVPPELFAETTLPLFAEDQKNGQARQLMEKEMRFAPATVTLMMEAHRLLGSETGKLQDAVSSLFQRCERMQDELKAQLERVAEISGKIDAVLDDNAAEPEDGNDTNNATILERLDAARSRREQIEQRYAQLRDKVSQLDKRPLSEKERPWIQEIDDLGRLILNEEDDDSSDADESRLRQRYKEVGEVKEDLVQRSGQFKDEGDEQEDEASPRKHKQRMDQVSTMLERETALVDAAAAKLEELRMLA